MCQGASVTEDCVVMLWLNLYTESYIRGGSWLRLRSLEGKDGNCSWNGLDCAEAAVIGRLGWKKGPSSAFAGAGERLPGIGSEPNPFLLVWTGEWSLVSVTKLQTCPTSRSPRREVVDWTARRLRPWLSGGCKNSDAKTSPGQGMPWPRNQ